MKRISLVTIFDTINFGTYLQAFATAVKINELGGNVEVLWYERKHTWYRVPLQNKFHILRYVTFLYALFKRNKTFFQKRKCRKFVEKFVKVSKLYHTYEDLCKKPPICDVFVTGSDQVWNTIHNSGIEKIYYLDFVPDNIKKTAFSASIGMDYFEEQYREETISLLSRYDSISVRENQAVDLLQSIGVKSQKVVDPTFLLNRKEWSKYAKPFVHSKPYVLVYSVEGGECDTVVSKTAKQVANSIEGDVIEVNYVGAAKQIPNCDKRFYYATPETFLSLMLGASFAVISSFHGTAFSLNFQVPFITVAPERFSSRIDSLLCQTGTTDRKISQYNSEVVNEIISTKIDFHAVKQSLDIDVKQSLSFIQKQILDID